jgi:hypothetical protein
MYEHMRSIQKAISSRKCIRDLLEKCQCERHMKSREESVFDEDEAIMWEELLTRRPREFVVLTCSKEKEEDNALLRSWS